MKKKEWIMKRIEQMSDEQIELLYTLSNRTALGGTRELLKIFYPEKESKKIDTSYPIDYFRRIEETYPDLKNGRYVFDYNENEIWGNLLNINNRIADKLLDLLITMW